MEGWDYLVSNREVKGRDAMRYAGLRGPVGLDDADADCLC